MAASKQKASPDASSYGRPLPFRSREPAILANQHVSWAPINSAQELKSHVVLDKHSYSSANKENVKSWLDSTSPASVLNSNVTQQHVRNGAQLDPPTPSPVCSPSPSSPLASPRSSLVELEQVGAVSPLHHHHQNSSIQINSQAQPSDKKIEELTSNGKRSAKDITIDAPPDSPTGSAFSSGSEGGLLVLLASKLLSYKENGRRYSRYARESSGPIDEKHVMEDRSMKPPVEEITAVPVPFQEPVNGNNLYRTSSDAVSEYSLGSANDRTLSMEFDAMLAAAVATGISQASALQDQSQQQPLPDIQEDGSLRFNNVVVHQRNDTGSRALVRVGDMRGASTDDESSRLISALTVMRQGPESEDSDFHSTLSEMPFSSHSSINSGSRRSISEENNNMQIIPTTTTRMAAIESTYTGYTSTNVIRESSPRSSSSGSNREHGLAMVLATHVHTTAMHDCTSRIASDPSESTPSSSSSSFGSKDANMLPVTPLAPRQVLEKVRRERVFAQALAFQDAKSSKCNNRYKREESKISAWENQQRIKASIRMQKVEMKLEQERAKALEKMQNDIARAHKRAEERKASAEAVRATKTAKVVHLADSIRRTGHSQSGTKVGCFPF